MEPWIDYNLPAELIAQQPLRNRADARLLVVHRERQVLEHRHVRDLPELLAPDDRLVLNDTKVIPAQLRGVRIETGGRWQGLYLGANDEGDWTIVCKTRGRIREPEAIMLHDREGRPAAKMWLVERGDSGRWLARLDEPVDALALLDRVGRVPLPPYIRDGQMVDDDVERYQTVYARRPGAVAAPTAGLHFTPQLLQKIADRGIGLSAVTLHVGMGTFRPIAGDDPAEHSMHAEWGEASEAAVREINATRSASGRIVAVGTTAARVLETIAARGGGPGAATPLQLWSGLTSLYIRPPYQFRAVDALLTNFHFPRTTLLLLVQAFGGVELIRQAYECAVREQYRFYSYGDAMLVL